MTSTCNTCIYLHRFNEVAGQCKRHAPGRDEDDQAVFPWVKTLEDWCGEYSGNTQPWTESEEKAFAAPSVMPTILTIKPTPYHKDSST